MALSRARFPLLLALLGATACLPALDSPDTGTPAAVDEDGDGYTADEDCDDQDADVHPGASEICNELDDDCDDAVDDEDADLDTTSAELWYQDADEDGYGSEDVSMYACEQPDGYGQLTADCDDGDAEVNPGATEICNTVDDDCDGLIDDEDDSLDLESAALWFADSDGDGYGDAEAKDYGCDQISGYVDDGDLGHSSYGGTGGSDVILANGGGSLPSALLDNLTDPGALLAMGQGG